jgi:hypothetical protein
MAIPEKTSQYRSAFGFTGVVVKDNPDASDGTLMGGHLTAAGLITPPGASTAAAGTISADATVLPSGTASVYPTTGADGTKGVRISAADTVTGKRIDIANGAAAAVLKVYPPTGGTINGGSVDAAYSSASGRGAHLICLSGSGNTWAGF